MIIIKLGIEELDRGIGGGLPHPSLISIEGEHGSGKTVISQYAVHAFLKSGLRALVITSEATVKEYLMMMKSIGLDVVNHYVAGKLSIYPLHVEGGKWSEAYAPLFLKAAGNFLEIKKKAFDLAVIDSLSALTTNVKEHDILTFITRIKNLVSDGKTVILTFHPDFLERSSMTKLRASSDVYFVAKKVKFMGMHIKSLEVVKLWGSKGERKSSLYFDVDPQLGLRILPLGGVAV